MLTCTYILRRPSDLKYIVGSVSCDLRVTRTLFMSILRDPTLYPEPDILKPERFLHPDGTLRDDPILTSAFGFGKRICCGGHFADSSLFI